MLGCSGCTLHPEDGAREGKKERLYSVKPVPPVHVPARRAASRYEFACRGAICVNGFVELHRAE